ncbi:hypothetical protein KFL_002230020 [Klebsormidium nitens]|uniref:Anoctamin transmembrane domain-containing protein n=1 Tax=Klebsormidium nitens TaxID=105231 RepID=A0A1Y1I7Q8_KLENI|nr:hypothetical protein KFL_002230020 [Klebsormidium nitens]|eukprot:GAQ85181.1 hypothetical protein KFL_002230020 [Klebsormidium nitens]
MATGLARFGEKPFAHEAVEPEIAIVCAADRQNGNNYEMRRVGAEDAIDALVQGLEAAGLKVDRVMGRNAEQFLKVGAPLEVIGREAERLKLTKLTNLGIDTHFSWDLRDSFVPQPDGALFSRTERYQCLESIIESIEAKTSSPTVLALPGGKGHLEITRGTKAVAALREKGAVTDIFPLHNESQRQELVRHWPFNFLGGTKQPLDDIYSYFGLKVAMYFAFLGYYTTWLVFPAVAGALLHFVDLRSWNSLVPPLFAMVVVMWAVAFLAFWKRYNTELQARWEVNIEQDEVHTTQPWDEPTNEPSHGIAQRPAVDGPSRALQREEWKDRLLTMKNNLVAVGGIFLLQAPYEMLFVYCFHALGGSPFKYVLLGANSGIAGQITKLGSSVAMRLNKTQTFVSKEQEADALVYKTFVIYFLQSFMGFFYYAFYIRDFSMLRSYLFSRLFTNAIIQNITEVGVPIFTFYMSERKARQEEQAEKRETKEKASRSSASRVERESHMPAYVASIGGGAYDGTFDDFLELALQFGVVTMFAGAFPLVALFALVNNLAEIRSDSFKLACTMRRPVPHRVASIGAWLNIFQYLGVIAIVSNCLLLVVIYDEQKTWRIDPGLLVLLIVEHLLLLARNSLAWFIPPVPAWVQAKRERRRRIQQSYLHQSLSGPKDQAYEKLRLAGA